MPAIGGIVFDSAGAPVDRELRFYRRDTGVLLGKSRSSGGDGNPDPDFDKVSLLLHMDGADGSTAFADSSAAPKTVTAYGNAKVSTAQSKWGGAAALFGGGSDAIDVSAHADLGFASADYTIECWIYLGSAADFQTVFDTRISGSEGVAVYVGPEGRAFALAHNTNIFCYANVNAPLNSWYHLAVVRKAGVITGYVDGVAAGSAQDTRSYAAMTAARIGSNLARGQPFVGRIDDLRITKGVARYTANFTPPDAPFPDAPDPGGTMPLGEYYFATNYTGEVQVVCVDDASEPLENDLILRTFPV